MIKLFKKCALFFYSIAIRKMFISKVLKINILTLDLMNYVGLLETMGASVGAVCGSAITGVPTPLVTALGILVGKHLGKLADCELKEINKTLRIVDKRNDYRFSDKTENSLVEKFDECTNILLENLLFAISHLSENDKKSDDDTILSKVAMNLFNCKDSRFSCLFIAELMNDEKIRKNILEMIKTI